MDKREKTVKDYFWAYKSSVIRRRSDNKVVAVHYGDDRDSVGFSDKAPDLTVAQAFKQYDHIPPVTGYYLLKVAKQEFACYLTRQSKRQWRKGFCPDVFQFNPVLGHDMARVLLGYPRPEWKHFAQFFNCDPFPSLEKALAKLADPAKCASVPLTRHLCLAATAKYAVPTVQVNGVFVGTYDGTFKIESPYEDLVQREKEKFQ